jgi:ribosome-binding factor A
MAGRKRQHLNEVIRHKLSTLLLKEANDPRFHSVTITDVTVAKDGSTARVQFSAYDPAVPPEVLAASLNRAAGFFSQALGRTLSTRRTPRLYFYYDPGFDHSAELDTLLHTIEPLPEDPHDE